MRSPGGRLTSRAVRILGLLLLAALLAGCVGSGPKRDCATAKARATGWFEATPTQRSVLAGDINGCGVLRKLPESNVETLLGTPSRVEAGRWIYLIDDHSSGAGWLRVGFTKGVVSDVYVKSAG
jgi:hypothetical protein